MFPFGPSGKEATQAAMCQLMCIGRSTSCDRLTDRVGKWIVNVVAAAAAGARLMFELESLFV